MKPSHDALFMPPSLDESMLQAPQLHGGGYGAPVAVPAGVAESGRQPVVPPRVVPPREGYATAATCCQDPRCAYAADEGSDSSESEATDQQHYADVCYSLLAYAEDAESDIESIEDFFRNVLDPHDLALMKAPGIKMVEQMRRCASINAEFLTMLVRSDECIPEFWELPPNHQVQERNSVKVRTVLRQFVRDWADEGAEERRSQYGCLLDALEKYIPLPKQAGGQPFKKPRVLAPGSGLARLPFECARRGYAAQGNEFSYHMLQGSKWVLNETSADHTHTIYPFILNMENRKSMSDHMRGVCIPDVCPSAILCPPGVETGPEDFSMCAGEFVNVYEEQYGAWDAVLTCFFLDTAKNVFLYIRTIADIIRPGGLWANIGPLLYHFAEQPDNISIELSWEEIKPAIRKYFDFKEEDMREGFYTTNREGLYRTRYRCIFFAAIRNDTPTDGESNPVYT